MENFEFRQLDERDEKLFEDFTQEFIARGEKIIPSSVKNQSFHEWLEEIERHHKGIDLLSGRVPSTIYFLIRKKDQKILGAIDIRHRLNENLFNFGGNIGYGVRPSERRKGYASLMLSLALEKCRELGMDKVLITCDKNNIASAKTIIKQGGVLEDERKDGEDIVRQRYWINLEK